MLMLRSARGKFSTGLSTETGDLILKSNQSRFDDLETWKGHQSARYRVGVPAPPPSKTLAAPSSSCFFQA
jgi:hypothetical protein